jgi:hypothetical protein
MSATDISAFGQTEIARIFYYKQKRIDQIGLGKSA